VGINGSAGIDQRLVVSVAHVVGGGILNKPKVIIAGQTLIATVGPIARYWLMPGLQSMVRRVITETIPRNSICRTHGRLLLLHLSWR
jgi:hypothetical protein